MRTRRLAAIAALLFVYALVRAFWWFDGRDQSGLPTYTLAAGFFKIFAWVVPSVLAALLVCRGNLHKALDFLGLDGNIARGIRFGLLATLPLAFAAAFSPPARIDLDLVVATALVGPFAEEVLFRGFLLRMLLVHARWPMGWAIGVGALAFGAAHAQDLDVRIFGNLYQFVVFSNPVSLGNLGFLGMGVLTMATGGALFGWVFYRCGGLWPAVFLHAAMNLWLTVAAGEERAAAGMFPDAVGLAQAASIAVALVLTFRWRPSPTASWSAQPS